jgi:hypothetical protein
VSAPGQTGLDLNNAARSRRQFYAQSSRHHGTSWL